MSLFVAALLMILLGGCLALFSRRPIVSSLHGASGAVLGSAVGLVVAVHALIKGGSPAIRLPWSVPFAEFSIQIDPLSAFFLIPLFLLSLLTAIYGVDYLLPMLKGRNTGLPWFFFNILIASMAVVFTARNGILFLLAWEVMALSSFFLVVFESDKRAAREAGWIYMIATHLGTAFLLVMFILLARESGSFDFDGFAALAGQLNPRLANLLFVFALIGFGVKAGFMPLHVWLPEAHPAAPSHVSAVMSGIMIKTGIYGLVRTLTFMGTPPLWWGIVMVSIGVTSGVFGVMLALAQHDLKRLLAYHSVENIGIIALGLGVGMIGLNVGSPPMAVVGFAGALLHVVNHALFKGLLFLGAGAVYHATGTREIESLGGLLKRMPVTGAGFLIGAAAISGLPPFNGFVSEFLIYLASFRGVMSQAPYPAIAMIAVIAALALIGGLAVACFTKAFGIVFLGEARTPAAAEAHEVGPAMTIPMVVLAACCVAVALFAPFVVQPQGPMLATITRLPTVIIQTEVGEASGVLATVLSVVCGFGAVLGLLILIRRRLLNGKTVTASGTWDCGYIKPTARMQYTASSYAQPLTEFFRVIIRTHRKLRAPRGFFPQGSSFESHAPDVMSEEVYRPVFSALRNAFGKMRRIQGGRIQLYVLYIVLALLALLLWQMRQSP